MKEIQMNHYYRYALLLGVLFGTPLHSFAETPPPSSPYAGEAEWPATLKQKPASGLLTGTFQVQFEKTTLAEVLHATGVGKISHRGDAGNSEYWLCYTNVSPTQVERLWITSGEMGGSVHSVLSVSAKIVPNGSATTDCPALPKNLTPVSLDNKLWVGASTDAATSTLGAPSHQKGAWRSYDFEGKVPGSCDGGFDLGSWLWLSFKNGHINSLHAGQVTSC